MEKKTGKVVAIGNTEQITTQNSTFTKRTITIETREYDRYTGEQIGQAEYLEIPFINKRAECLAFLMIGDTVEVTFVVQGARELDKARFPRIAGIEAKARTLGNAEQVQQQTAPHTQYQAPPQQTPPQTHDDLPFE